MEKNNAEFVCDTFDVLPPLKWLEYRGGIYGGYNK